MTATRRTLDCGIYKATLVDAFINITDDFETMNYDIIERELKTQHFYKAFLASLGWMSLIFQCGVVHWSFEELKVELVNTKNVVTYLYDYWKIYMDVHNNDVIRYLEM